MKIPFDVAYSGAQPFRHWILDGLELELDQAVAEVPPFDWFGWVRYDNDCERGKRTAERIDRPALRRLFDGLSALAAPIGDLTGIGGLTATERCGGLQVTDPGGSLGCHLDAALYPDGERRLNLILFLNRVWPVDAGGALELYDESAGAAVSRIRPRFGRAVLWESSDLAYHAVGRVAPHAPSRITAAVYYLAPARPGCVRRRALFVPRR